MTCNTSKSRQLALRNAFERGAHREQDSVPAKATYVEKTLKNHRNTLKRYIEFCSIDIEKQHEKEDLPPPTFEDVKKECLKPDTEVPAMCDLKDFVRYYIHTSRALLDKEKRRPTIDSIKSIMEFFFAGFTRATGTVVEQADRSEIYYWIRTTLHQEGLVVWKFKEKHNFTVVDLVRVLKTLWTKDDLMFIPERYRIQFTFALRIYCWTGARLDTFFKGGLRYRDITPVLQRVQGGGWRFIFRLDQRWVKNNRDPENIVFGTALHEQEQLMFDDASFFLALAFFDQAIFGYQTLNDLRQQRMPEGQNELTLRFREEVLDKYVLRQCTMAGGLSDQKMSQSAFTSILTSTMHNAGYSHNPGIHAIRRGLGKKVDEIYTEVQRSQHLTQSDPRVFGTNYVADMSSVDGQAAYLGKTPDHTHIDYFQSCEKYREPGMPCELPAEIRNNLKMSPGYLQYEQRLAEVSNAAVERNIRKEFTNFKQAAERAALKQYQHDWTRERRDWKVQTRGEKQPDDTSRVDLVHCMSYLTPERQRITEHLTSTLALTDDSRWNVCEDLYKLCARNSTTIYLPGHDPIEDKCPIRKCSQNLIELQKSERNRHINNCQRAELARRHDFPKSQIHYCYLCYEWLVGGTEWELHCQLHLMKNPSKRCGSMTRCSTMIRPAYCPFCLGNSDISASQRLQQWSRDRDLWLHIDENHMVASRWPRVCPHPSCHADNQDARQFGYHLIDEHSMGRTIPREAESFHSTDSDTLAPKRKASVEMDLKWVDGNVQKKVKLSKKAPKPTQEKATDGHLGSALREARDTVAPLDLLILDAHNYLQTHRTESSTLVDSASELSQKDWTSCENTLVDNTDDELFSQFLRSPSPDVHTANHIAESHASAEANLVVSPPTIRQESVRRLILRCASTEPVAPSTTKNRVNGKKKAVVPNQPQKTRSKTKAVCRQLRSKRASK